MNAVPSSKLALRLFGPFSVYWMRGAALGDEIPLRSGKIRALLALLATAPGGKRTRAYLQDMLWSRSGPEHGRASLRRALSDLRALLDGHFDEIFEANNLEIRVLPGAVEVIGNPSEGVFLEGLDIAADEFEDWLREQRQAVDPAPVPAQPTTPGGTILAAESHLNPCIALLPLAAQPGDSDSQVLGDLVAEEMSRALSRSSLIDVISHLSCRGLDPRVVSLDQVREHLGADYLVAGRVRPQGGAHRAAVEFIDTSSGRIRWTQEFDFEARRLCSDPEALLGQTCADIGRAILDTAIEMTAMQPLEDVKSHQLMISAITLMHRQSLSSFSRARPQLLELLSRAPRHAALHAWLSKWYVLSVQQGWSVDLDKDRRIASDLSRKALDLDPECSFSLAIDGFVNNNLLKRFDESEQRFDQAISLNPSNALAWLLKGTLYAFVDQGEEAVRLTTRSRRLSPLDPHRYFFDSLSATAHLAARDYKRALELSEASLKLNRRHTSTLRVRTIALHQLGELDKARQSASELRRLEPTLTIRKYLENHPAAEFETGREWATALGNSGVPHTRTA